MTEFENLGQKLTKSYASNYYYHLKFKIIIIISYKYNLNISEQPYKCFRMHLNTHFTILINKMNLIPSLKKKEKKIF